MPKRLTLIPAYGRDYKSKKAVQEDLDAAYRQMAQEEAREAEALQWSEATLGDVADEAR